MLLHVCVGSSKSHHSIMHTRILKELSKLSAKHLQINGKELWKGTWQQVIAKKIFRICNFQMYFEFFINYFARHTVPD